MSECLPYSSRSQRGVKTILTPWNSARHKIQWHWLKGHAGHPDNEHCDKIARAEISKLRKQYTAEQLACLFDEFKEGRSHGGNQGQFL